MAKINIVDETIQAGKMMKIGEFLWKPTHSEYITNSVDENYEIEGPYCKSCRSPYWLNQSTYKKGEKIECDVCGKTVTLKREIGELKNSALKAIYSYLNADKEIISLDNPVSNVFDKVQDDMHIVKVFLSQKDGRKTALVYIIEKAAKGEKAQVFLDVENEQVRFDPNDLPPMKMLAKMKVEFKDSVHETNYKPEK